MKEFISLAPDISTFGVLEHQPVADPVLLSLALTGVVGAAMGLSAKREQRVAPEVQEINRVMRNVRLGEQDPVEAMGIVTDLRTQLGTKAIEQEFRLADIALARYEGRI